LAGGAPEIIGDVADGMEGEGQQVEAGEYGSQVLLAVAEVVFEVVAVVLEGVEGLVLDLPSGAAAGGEFDDVVGTDGQIADPAVAVGGLALGVEDLDLEPASFLRRASLPSRSGTSRSQR